MEWSERGEGIGRREGVGRERAKEERESEETWGKGRGQLCIREQIRNTVVNSFRPN